MAGCRIAFAVGRSEVFQALAEVKSNIDYGVFLPVQMAGIEALRENMDKGVPSVRRIYEQRRDDLWNSCEIREASRQAESDNVRMGENS